MERPRNIGGYDAEAPSEDEFGELIRWSLEGTLSGAEPPAEIWPKILAQVREIDAFTNPQRQRKRATLPLTSFIQAVIISIMLLAFGLGVERSILPTRDLQSASATLTAPRVSVPQETFQDMLRGHLLLQKEKELPVRMRYGEALAETQNPWANKRFPDFDK